MQYETCRHVKEDGTYCGSPALQSRKYCHHHLTHLGRRLRRARALRDNVPYRLDIPALEDLAAVLVALSEITQALGSGQLDHRAAGKMLYAIQQTTSVIKFTAKLQAAQSQTTQQLSEKLLLTTVSYQGAASAAPPPAETTSGLSPCDSATAPAAPALSPARLQAYPAFEQDFGLEPGSDLDAEINSTLRTAEEEAELRHADAPPPPPPGVRLGSAQYHLYREEAYQALNIRINKMRHELRDYYAAKRVENEQLAKQAMGVTLPPKLLPTSA